VTLRAARRRASVLCSVVAASAGLALVAAPAGAKAAATTCSQITKAMAQPLEKDPITKVETRSVPGAQYLQKQKSVGQTCVFGTSSTDDGVAITVISGPSAKRAWQSELQGLGSSRASVPGVGDKAVRQRADSDGGVSTAEVGAIKGSTYCRVDAEESAEEAALEDAAGTSGRIGDQAYAIIAAAEGTLCNRVFGSGNTTPDLSKLSSITPPSTTEGGIDGIPGT
jgi:hypothetical protein